MTNLTALSNRWAPHMLSLCRVIIALLFLEHGLQKLYGFPPGGGGPFSPGSLMGVAGIIEFVGGILLLVGLRVHLVSFILAGEMAVAYFIAHAHGSFYPVVNHGELAVLYCFIFLYFAVAGGGLWSIDYLRRKATQAPQSAP
jgi:putative oxidoreductase